MKKKDLMRHINETVSICFKNNTHACGILKYDNTKPYHFYIDNLTFKAGNVNSLLFEYDQWFGYTDKNGHDTIVCKEHDADKDF